MNGETTQDTNKILQAMLVFDEGVRPDLYPDSKGYWTIGIGHLVTKVKMSSAEAMKIVSKQLGREIVGNRITQEDITFLFEKDLADVKRGISQNAFVNEVYQSLDPIRQLAIENMCFQMGVAGVAGFRNTLKYALNKQWDAAYQGCINSKWGRTDSPKRAKRVATVLRDGNIEAYQDYIKIK